MECGRSRTKGKQWNVRAEGLTPSQQRCSPGLQGAVHWPCTTCAMWNDGIFEVAHTLVGFGQRALVICVSSAKMIGAQREGELGCDGKGFGRKATRMDKGGFGGEARRVRACWRTEDVTWSKVVDSEGEGYSLSACIQYQG